MTKVKICGVKREIDVDAINNSLPEYVGFVFYNKSKRFIDDKKASKLRNKISDNVKTVGVFVNDDINHIFNLYRSKIINVIQLHGDEDENYINKIRYKLPEAEVWKSFIIRDEIDIQDANNCSADMVVLDNGYGDGKCFDWTLIRYLNRPFILAGGLNIDNVASAIYDVHPYCIDISSGVETRGLKDGNKIEDITMLIRSIDNIRYRKSDY